MTTVDQIKQEIKDWYDDPEEPFIAAFTSFIHTLSWRRTELTFPSGIAKLHSVAETEAIFYVGDKMYAAYKDRDKFLNDGTVLIADWQADDLSEVEPVNVIVTEFQKKDSTDAL
jgi:hypothetical protein